MLPEAFFVPFFVSGLFDELRAGVKLLNPRSLTQAFVMARQYEKVFHALAKSLHDKPHLGTISTQANLEAVGASSCSTTKVDLPIYSYQVNSNPTRYETIKYQLATRATYEGSFLKL